MHSVAVRQVAIIVAYNSPLDQHYMAHPECISNHSGAICYSDRDNPSALVAHVKRAASEHPLHVRCGVLTQLTTKTPPSVRDEDLTSDERWLHEDPGLVPVIKQLIHSRELVRKVHRDNGDFWHCAGGSLSLLPTYFE